MLSCDSPRKIRVADLLEMISQILACVTQYDLHEPRLHSVIHQVTDASVSNKTVEYSPWDRLGARRENWSHRRHHHAR